MQPQWNLQPAACSMLRQALLHMPQFRQDHARGDDACLLCMQADNGV